MVGQGQHGVKIELGEALGRDAKEVIHISCGTVITAGTVADAGTCDSRVEGAWERWNLRPIVPDDGP